jgi:hypothetical protein
VKKKIRGVGREIFANRRWGEEVLQSVQLDLGLALFMIQHFE